MTAQTEFLRARDFLLEHRDNYDRAYREFQWPRLVHFNWALDYFDHLARGNSGPALVVSGGGSATTFTFDELRIGSNQVANFLRSLGVRRGDRILVMLSNTPLLWQLLLAAMKLGAVVVPTSTLLTTSELADRLDRAQVGFIVADSAETAKFGQIATGRCCIVAGEKVAGWHDASEAGSFPETFLPDGPTAAADILFLYFTSGTTAKAKLVGHTHQSYPVGHLSTMYWVGLRPGDVHWNISSPGWAKHAWSSFFAPWNAGATVFCHGDRFDALQTLDLLRRHAITSLCAPPTVWRLLIQEDLRNHAVRLREAVSAGEPLNPEVITQVRDAWGLTIRDGYGQTETTAQIGNSPGQDVSLGSMGRPLPGYQLDVLGSDNQPGMEGELVIDIRDRPLGLMAGYFGEDTSGGELGQEGFYRTGDVVRRDASGFYWYVGRRDDVFKCSDYRISPFELESVLLEHPAVAEAAVVASPDPARLHIPKAFIVLCAGHQPDRDTALDLFRFVRERCAPFKRIRRIEFADLPKTLTGKIRRSELRAREERRSGIRPACEFLEEDFDLLRQQDKR